MACAGRLHAWGANCRQLTAHCRRLFANCRPFAVSRETTKTKGSFVSFLLLRTPLVKQHHETQGGGHNAGVCEPPPFQKCLFRRGGGGWHQAMVLVCLP